MVPVTYVEKAMFRRWCATATPVPRPSQVNLRGLHPLVRAEIAWGLFAHMQGPHSRWELPWVQGLASYCREHGLRSVTDLTWGPGGPRPGGRS